MESVTSKTLKDVMPHEFMGGEYCNDRAYTFRDVEVIQEHSLSDNNYVSWPGTRNKNVMFWVKLSNGYAVGFNENPARGWSFPVIKIK